MVQMVEIENCCTASLIYNFGGTRTAGILHRGLPTKENVITDVASEVGWLREYGYAVAVAFTNNEQKAANEALKELGFLNSGMMSKGEHPETKLIMWWLPLGEVEPLPEVEVKAGPARDARGRFVKKEIS